MSNQAAESTFIEKPQKAKINLLGFSLSRMGDFFEQLGEKRFRATQVIKWIHQEGECDFNNMTNCQKPCAPSFVRSLKLFCPKW